MAQREHSRNALCVQALDDAAYRGQISRSRQPGTTVHMERLRFDVATVLGRPSSPFSSRLSCSEFGA